jgi:anti-anti-sigma factor
VGLATAEPSSPHLMLSAQLVSELGDGHSTLRATAERCDSAVIVYAGGEVDACNEHTWQRLLSEVAAIVTSPGSLVLDVTGLEFMACCAFAALAEEADRCRRRGVKLCLVSLESGVARTVHACGLADVLPVYVTADAALSAEPVC